MNTANEREITKEQYFTDPELAAEIIDDLSETDLWKTITHIIEPSCGSGSFLLPIKNKIVIGYDIEPKVSGQNIIKSDFLKVSLPQFCDRQKVLCLGNPPFGRNGILARQFINKCATVTKTQLAKILNDLTI
jgi:predicted RNA methylase